MPHLYSTTALAWDATGGRLAVGTAAGAAALYAASLRRARYCPRASPHSYDLTWLSRSQVQIAAAAASFKISARGGHDITKVDIYRDKYVVAFTTATLLLGNLATFKLAEIDWCQSGGERFCFENDRVALVYNLGELTVVQYDRNAPLATLRSEHVSPYLVSCAVGPARGGGGGGGAGDTRGVAAVAHLVDTHTIRILDMHTKTGPQARLLHH